MSNGMIILFAFLLMFSVPVLIVFLVLAIVKNARKKKIAICTEMTEGTVIKIKRRGVDAPIVLVVEYEVGGEKYTISESLKFKSELIKIGPIPIGQSKSPVMGTVAEGKTVTVCYQAANPKKAIIKDNEGLMNC